ncbi:MAG: agmatinase [Methyloligellaceae bacterium]
MGKLSYRPPERSFLGAEGAAERPQEAAALVIPFPLEATVTYGGGTARGAEAIIAASPELEFFDEALGCEPCHAFGIATLEAPRVATPVAAAVDQVASLVSEALHAGHLPLVLGGEHSLTAGAVRPFAERYSDLVVLQFDAHADLRDVYRGERHNHGCAMRRVLDAKHVRLVAVGLRNISAEEAAFAEANRDRVSVHWARSKAEWDPAEIVAPLAGKPIYVTFDVDGFDASLMPATGTPEPGGLFWDDAMAVLEAAAGVGTVVGADVVELAPIDGIRSCDFTAAKLAYKVLSLALTGPDNALPPS